MLPKVKSVLREQCCVKGQYTEQWKYFEQVHSRTKRNYENMFFSDGVFFTWSRNVSSPVNRYQLCKNPCAVSLCNSELEFWWLCLVTSDTIHLELNRRRENEQLLCSGHWHSPALRQILGEWFITCRLWHLRSPELIHMIVMCGGHCKAEFMWTIHFSL